MGRYEELKEAAGKVRVENKEGNILWMERGIRQWCPLSPSLFTLLIADLDEKLERESWGGIKVGGKKFFFIGVRR